MLTPAQYEALSAVFEAQLREIAEKIILFRSGQYRIEGKPKRKSTSESSNLRGGASSRTDIHWGSKVTYNPNPSDNKPKLTVTTTEPDPEEESLVRYLIGAPTTEKSPMMSFRPGAWTALAVKRSGADSAKIKNLTLKVHYVFQSVDDAVFTTVGVKVADDAQPYIRCTVPDANGRTDGVGSFLRTFKKNKNRVTVTAPWRYGNRRFRGWHVGTDPGEEGPLRDEQLTLSQSVELNLQKIPYHVLGAVFAPVNFEPVNDKGEGWLLLRRERQPSRPEKME
jgi:hypothetical protein